MEELVVYNETVKKPKVVVEETHEESDE